MRPVKGYTVDSSSVQGDGSFITLKRLTYGERNAAIRVIQETEGKELLDFYLSQIAELVIGWNWQNEQGDPIPLHKLEDLMPEEISFLVTSIGKLLRGELMLDVKN